MKSLYTLGIVLIFFAYLLTTIFTPVVAKQLKDDDPQNTKRYTPVYALSITAAITSLIVVGGLGFLWYTTDKKLDQTMTTLSTFCENAVKENRANEFTSVCSALPWWSKIQT